MHKLAALVKEGRVVFIGFNHKHGLVAHRAGAGRGALGRTQTGRDAKVQRHTAHQKARLQTCAFEYPCQHGCGGGLAVRTCDGQHMATAQHMFR